MMIGTATLILILNTTMILANTTVLLVSGAKILKEVRKED
jgi:hypothetical protein